MMIIGAPIIVISAAAAAVGVLWSLTAHYQQVECRFEFIQICFVSIYCVSWNEWLIIPFLFKFSFETTLPSYNLISKLNILISIKLSDAWDQVNNFSMDRFLSVLADFFLPALGRLFLASVFPMLCKFMPTMMKRNKWSMCSGLMCQYFHFNSALTATTTVDRAKSDPIKLRKKTDILLGIVMQLKVWNLIKMKFN